MRRYASAFEIDNSSAMSDAVRYVPARSEVSLLRSERRHLASDGRALSFAMGAVVVLTMSSRRASVSNRSLGSLLGDAVGSPAASDARGSTVADGFDALIAPTFARCHPSVKRQRRRVKPPRT
jgi:hypothetical protein